MYFQGEVNLNWEGAIFSVIVPRNREELSTLMRFFSPDGLIARQSVKVPPVSILIFQTGAVEVDKIVRFRRFRSVGHGSHDGILLAIFLLFF